MSRRTDMFARATAKLGDLDSPFYDEERQRDVWNEASAVGFQAMLWGCTTLAGLMAWAGGVKLAPWACALLALSGLAGWVTLTYARHQGVSGLEEARLLRPRVAIWLVVYLLTLASIAYRLFWGQATGDRVTGFMAGAVIGAVAGCGLLLAVRRQCASSGHGG